MNYQPDLISTALKMLGILVILLGGLLITLYLSKRVFKRRDVEPRGKMIKVLASKYLGVKKSISLVEIPGAVLVLGITSDRIALLSKIENAEILDEIRGPGDEGALPSFSDQLRRLSSRYRRGGNKQ